MMHILYTIALVVFNTKFLLSLDNGLALNPPMGWLAWERFRCNIDCNKDPKNCISEFLFKEMADAMVEGGFKEAGYEFINVDDCWLAKERDINGKLQADPKRFPSGIKALADYIHSKGLKFGIYEDFGTKTCGGFPGSEYYLQTDAQTFASWGVDMLKLDGCYAFSGQFDDAYPAMSFWLNKTGRPMVYSCSWPAYQMNIIPNYPKIGKFCNLWRNFADIQDSWESVLSIINFYGEDKGNFSRIAGKGKWNDPDMLILGNFGLSYEQERVQMGIWAMLSAPLFISADLRNIRHTSKSLLLNKHLIRLNKDESGYQARRINKVGNIQIWSKKLNAKDSFAFAFVNVGSYGMPSFYETTLTSLGGIKDAKYLIYEVFENKLLGSKNGYDKISANVNPTGIHLAKAVRVN